MRKLKHYQRASNIGIPISFWLISTLQNYETLQQFAYLGYVALILCSVLYYILLFNAVLLTSIENCLTLPRFYQYLSSLKKSCPTLSMQIVCYHTEYLGKHAVKDVTHTSAQEIQYCDCEDNSENMRELLQRIIKKKQNIVSLKLKFQTENRNDGTDEDLEAQKERFLAENKQDKNQEYTETVSLEGYQKHVLIIKDGSLPWLFSKTAYLLFGLLGFNLLYDLLINHNIGQEKYILRKLISTSGSFKY